MEYKSLHNLLLRIFGECVRYFISVRYLSIYPI